MPLALAAARAAIWSIAEHPAGRPLTGACLGCAVLARGIISRGMWLTWVTTWMRYCVRLGHVDIQGAWVFDAMPRCHQRLGGTGLMLPWRVVSCRHDGRMDRWID